MGEKLFTDKYAPRKKEDLLGNAASFNLIFNYMQGKPLPSRKKALWLTGPPGTGKTITVHTLAKELDLELIEINASDVRNTDAIESILGNAIKQMSLFSRGKVILIDEVDGLSGQKDRGGVGAIAKIIEESRFPLILTSFDAEESKLSSLKKICTIIPFEPHAASQLAGLMKSILAGEKIKVSDQIISLLSRKAGGDARAALNDLQVVSAALRSDYPMDDMASIDVLGDRRRIETMQQALLKIFKSSDPIVVLRVLDNVEEDIDELFLWLDENIPREYLTTEDRKNAFLMLAKADVFFGRIRRWQYYRFYAYCYDFLSAGIALSKEKKYTGAIEYQRTTRLLKIWMSNQQQAKRKSIALKLAPHLHSGSKRLIKDSMPYLRLVAKQPGFVDAWTEHYRLEEEEEEWLLKR